MSLFFKNWKIIYQHISIILSIHLPKIMFLGQKIILISKNSFIVIFYKEIFVQIHFMKFLSFKYSFY